MSQRDDLTEQLRMILLRRWWTTLHGFNVADVASPCVLVAHIHERTNINGNGTRNAIFSTTAINAISRASGVHQRLFHVVGDDVVLKSQRNRHLIPTLINGCLDAGFSITLHTKLKPYYTPTGPRFSLVASEHLVLPEFRRWLAEGMNSAIERLWQHGDPRLWVTPEGKQMAMLVRMWRKDWTSKFWDLPLQLGGPTDRQICYYPELDFPRPPVSGADEGIPEGMEEQEEEEEEAESDECRQKEEQQQPRRRAVTKPSAAVTQQSVRRPRRNRKPNKKPNKRTCKASSPTPWEWTLGSKRRKQFEEEEFEPPRGLRTEEPFQQWQQQFVTQTGTFAR